MPAIHHFGAFSLDANADTLFRGGEPVALGQRAVALLRVLVERAGAPVSKETMIESAWPGLAVEDSNLTVQIAAVRRALSAEPGGEAWIETLPRRGYRFVGPEVSTRTDAAQSQPGPEMPQPDRPSIAVLPFQNLSDDPQQDYFADGVIEDIITGLSRIRWLFVIARNSSFTYRERTVDIKQVGRELGVRYVLQGSVRKAGVRVRISAQLVAAESGVQLWGERYDRSLEDIFALQDEITLSVVGAIEPSLRDAEIQRVKRKRPDSLDAYDLFLRALPHTYFIAPEEAAKAVPLLEQALTLEPDYADAHGLLAWCHEILYVWAGFADDHRIAGIRHARAALTHGRDDAMALAFGGFATAMLEHDRATAGEAFERALALSPCSAFALFLGSVALVYGGDAERSIDWAERALRVSPLDHFSFAPYHAFAVGHFLLGHYDQAANAARRAVQANPRFSVTHSLLAAALTRLGRTDEARMAGKQVLALQPSFSASRVCAAIGIAPALARSLTEAWQEAGLPP